MARYVPVLIVILLGAAVGVGLTFPARTVGAQGGAPGQNDAGSGSDAGDTPQVALLLPGARRMWSANLTPTGTDADWYRLAPTGAYCAAADATTSAPGLVSLLAEVDRNPGASRSSSPHATLRLALAGEAGTRPYLGIEPPPMMLMAASSATPSPGRYTFALGASSHAQLDPEADGESPEAGATPATSAALAAGCTAGRLATGAGDAEDRYHIDVASARELTLSFAIDSGDPVEARLIAPSGATYAVLQSGESAEVWAGETGRWTVALAYPGATGPIPLPGTLLRGASEVMETTYLLGLTDGPEPEPCRPTCV